MSEKMLIDASHEEETRVVVVRGNRIEEFDFESQHKKQLRGNIYLAKVTRVEPSLQAAFVEYGGNRHGFLAFSEIHPDYYQIPLADRQALLQAEAEAEQAEAEDENGDAHSEGDSEPAEAKPARPKSRRGRSRKKANDETKDGVDAEKSPESGDESKEPADAKHESDTGLADDDNASSPDEMLAAVDTDTISEEVHGKHHDDDDDDNGNGHKIDSVGAEDALEEVPDRSHKKPRRQYRIQEVVKRRQILLVQVVKEERGNKGAALTTYLSLAGRYSVLMPNTARGGGISRKITNVQDRKRLKEIARELEVPQGMGVILRTAGANRTKAEIKRDFEYLMRLWENVRSLTLSSTAPTLVYEEGSLIKRSIRDLYNKDISEIVVSGEEGYREAKTFMKMLMPSHAKVVQPYRDIHPIYARSGIEAQLDRMLQPQVTLKSGGYIIINQTEALVAIDVNSGRSTKEHSIEDTALQTNLEAAEEVARQLRLRDLAGLIVIDFIDMEEKRNNRSVEKKVKECLKHDRARIQVGRISHFGLLEMSRQRIRASVLESTTQVCEACGGTGHVRSKSSVALHCIRGIEEYLLKNTTHNITVRARPETALYLLNQKRDTIVDLEKRFGLLIIIESDTEVGSQHFAIDRGEPVDEPVNVDQIVHFDTPLEDEAEEVAEVENDVKSANETPSDDSDGGRPRKRRRRRRGGRSDDENESEETSSVQNAGENGEDSDDEDSSQRKRRRRGKRGGRRKRNEERADTQSDSVQTEAADVHSVDEPEARAPQTASPDKPSEAGDNETPAEEAVSSSLEESETRADAPKRKRPRRGKAKDDKPESGDTTETKSAKLTEASEAPDDNAASGDETGTSESDEKSAGQSKRRARTEQIAGEPVLTSSSSQKEEEEKDSDKPKKAGWWQRRGFF